MLIDGLGSMLGILPVKKEKEAGQAPMKNQKKNKKREQKKDDEEGKEKEGRVDIRI